MTPPPLVRRSTLILPVNVPRFLEKAHLRGADAVMLDLEDAVPPKEKPAARRLVREAIPHVGRGGAEVFVRVNHESALLEEDLEAAIFSGLTGICFPKTESAEEVERLDMLVSGLEGSRGVAAGGIELALLIESPRGVLNAEAIAAASRRVRTITLGPEDYCLSIGVEPSAQGSELLYPLSKIVTVAVAAGIAPMGLMGSIGSFKDLDRFEQAARRARDLGCLGASCIHPDQISVLNRVFSPTPDQVANARETVDAFEAGVKRGTASVGVGGSMVDIPVYARATRIVQKAEAIAAVDQRKADALARLR
jgi:citrate lyase subunit beta / citryl-CoA lyase